MGDQWPHTKSIYLCIKTFEEDSSIYPIKYWDPKFIIGTPNSLMGLQIHLEHIQHSAK